jgi:uncharacterized protein YjlB
MKRPATEYSVEQFFLGDDGTFPNSKYPALLYKSVLKLPFLFAPLFIRRLFRKNGWSNAWNYGVYEYHHYHSITHEVLGIHKGEATLQLGGSKGARVKVRRGDVLIIPAGVAHKNLDKENSIKCIGAYPGGSDYDINYGKVGERPMTDRNIEKVHMPKSDPVFGKKAGIIKFW